MSTALRLSFDLLNAAPLLYFTAMVLGVLYWVRQKKGLATAITVIAGLALLLHTTALGIRWIEGGLYRPPWTNLYESLIYFSWGLALVCFFCELKFRIRSIGIFAYALVFATLGLAFLTPQKAINPLVPALQSWWILAHSFLAAFAYSGLIVASVFSFLYLIKKGLTRRTLVFSSTLVGIATVLLSGGKDLFSQGIYRMNEMIFYNGVWMKNPIAGTDPQEFYQLTLSMVGPLMGLSLLLYVLAAVFLLMQRRVDMSCRSLGFIVFSAAVLCNIAFVVDIYIQIGLRENLTLASSPYHLVFMSLFTSLQVFLWIVCWRPHALPQYLPAAETLDRLANQLTMFGFPFMTLILITGAIWAHEAWGRYWGWDPKETTAFVTWLIYALYLHARRLPAWKARRAAVISVVGFFSVIFTYLGTNLVLSGLHSYGAQ
jgi:ABC-type transport system involved in cytochrome c biogenesis permease subunit